MTGVSLNDFRPLFPAEEALLQSLNSGIFDRTGDGLCPESGVQENEVKERTIRAGLLRYLLLDGRGDIRPHEKGLWITGALITGILDLEGCRIPRVIALRNCRFMAAPVLRAAIIDSLELDGSSLPGLNAEGLEVRGGISLIGATVSGAIFMPGCRLGGSLRCDRATLSSAKKTALDADALIARSVLMRKAKVEGGISLFGARLGMDLNATDCQISHQEGIAINADGIEARGNILLRACRIKGEVRMIGAYIAGDMDFSGAALTNPGNDALQLNRAVIKGGFFLREQASIQGTLDMTGATMGTLHDDLACWPDKGDLLLNRCLYNAFIDGPVDARSRLEWLDRQSPERWGQDFWPQPYEQLATVFQSMGHDDDARSVLIAKERLQRRARRDRAKNPIWRATLAAKDAILAVTVLYGRQPLIAFVWLLLFWLLGIGIFGYAESQGAFKPASAVVLRSPEWTFCAIDNSKERVLPGNQQSTAGRALPGQNQLSCFQDQWEAASYPRFNASMYSLDTLFPVLEIDQKSFWRPDQSKPWGTMAIWYFYIQSVLGWALSLLAVAGFSGLVKSR